MIESQLNGRMLVSDPRDREIFNTQLLYFTCSSLSEDGERVYMISDKTGSPNVIVRDLVTGEETYLTDNHKGILKSYVYFDGTPGEGLGKASVCLDYKREVVYYIQDNMIYKTERSGNRKILAQVPENRVTAFTHISGDGNRLCVPMTDGRCL